MAVKNLQRVSTYLDPKMVIELDSLAEHLKISRSDLIRKLLEEGFKWGGYLYETKQK